METRRCRSRSSSARRPSPADPRRRKCRNPPPSTRRPRSELTAAVVEDLRPRGAVARDLDARRGVGPEIRVQPALETQPRLLPVAEIDRAGREIKWAADDARIIAVEIDAEHVRAGRAGVRIGQAVADAALAGRIAKRPLALARPARIGIRDRKAAPARGSTESVTARVCSAPVALLKKVIVSL